MLELTGARGHQVFSGRIDIDELRFADKAIVLATRAPRSDFRDWDEIRAWAGQIAEALAAEVT
jgi:menaquinone-dependent protoporphyrinogen oxidase